MAINFPDSPTTNQEFTSGATTWIWDGVKWGLKTVSANITTAPVGTMLDWPVTSAYPTGYLRADGSAISRSTYAGLYALIGTTYGTGDGSTTFNLPNIASAGTGSPVKLIKSVSSGIVEPSTVAHASSHIRAGSDIIDGDRVQVDYVPTNYSRNAAASGAGAVTDLTAHLSGIDMILPAGIMMPYAGATEPAGWVFCYGQTVNSVSNTAYARLFTAIGTIYGGSSASSFILPDLRGRSVFGKDNMGGTTASRVTSASGVVGTTLGAVGGDQRIQDHTHTFSVSGVVDGGAAANFGSAYTVGARTSFSGTTANHNQTSGGASQNMPPTIITNYVIKL
jgi:microcystin-dependent protein